MNSLTAPPAWTTVYHAHACRAVETVADLQAELQWVLFLAVFSVLAFIATWLTAWCLNKRCARLRDDLVDAGDEIDDLQKANTDLRAEVETRNMAAYVNQATLDRMRRERDFARAGRDCLEKEIAKVRTERDKLASQADALVVVRDRVFDGVLQAHSILQNLNFNSDIKKG